MRTVSLVSKSAGVTIIELMVAAGVTSLLVLGTMSVFQQYQNFRMRAESVTALQALKDEMSDAMNRSVGCVAAFGAQQINPAAPTTVSVNTAGGGGLPLYISPTPAQNIVNQWQVTQVQVVPIGDPVPSANVGQVYLAANLVLTAVPRSGVGSSEMATLAMGFLLDGANNIVSCSSARRGGEPVPLPTCTSDQRLVLQSPAPNTAPVWTCRKL